MQDARGARINEEERCNPVDRRNQHFKTFAAHADETALCELFLEIF